MPPRTRNELHSLAGTLNIEVKRLFFILLTVIALSIPTLADEEDGGGESSADSPTSQLDPGQIRVIIDVGLELLLIEDPNGDIFAAGTSLQAEVEADSEGPDLDTPPEFPDELIGTQPITFSGNTYKNVRTDVSVGALRIGTLSQLLADGAEFYAIHQSVEANGYNWIVMYMLTADGQLRRAAVALTQGLEVSFAPPLTAPQPALNQPQTYSQGPEYDFIHKRQSSGALGVVSNGETGRIAQQSPPPPQDSFFINNTGASRLERAVLEQTAQFSQDFIDLSRQQTQESELTSTSQTSPLPPATETPDQSLFAAPTQPVLNTSTPVTRPTEVASPPVTLTQTFHPESSPSPTAQALNQVDIVGQGVVRVEPQESLTLGGQVINIAILADALYLSDNELVSSNNLLPQYSVDANGNHHYAILLSDLQLIRHFWSVYGINISQFIYSQTAVGVVVSSDRSELISIGRFTGDGTNINGYEPIIESTEITDDDGNPVSILLFNSDRVFDQDLPGLPDGVSIGNGYAIGMRYGTGGEPNQTFTLVNMSTLREEWELEDGEWIPVQPDQDTFEEAETQLLAETQEIEDPVSPIPETISINYFEVENIDIPDHIDNVYIQPDPFLPDDNTFPLSQVQFENSIRVVIGESGEAETLQTNDGANDLTFLRVYDSNFNKYYLLVHVNQTQLVNLDTLNFEEKSITTQLNADSEKIEPEINGRWREYRVNYQNASMILQTDIEELDIQSIDSELLYYYLGSQLSRNFEIATLRITTLENLEREEANIGTRSNDIDGNPISAVGMFPSQHPEDGPTVSIGISQNFLDERIVSAEGYVGIQNRSGERESMSLGTRNLNFALMSLQNSSGRIGAMIELN